MKMYRLRTQVAGKYLFSSTLTGLKLKAGLRIGLSACLATLFSFSTLAKDNIIATLEVESGSAAKHYFPLSINSEELSALNNLTANKLQLFQVNASSKEAIPFQLSNDKQPTLTWLARASGGRQQRFELHYQAQEKSFPPLQIKKEKGRLTISHNQQNLLGYQYTRLAPPKGVDPNYGRSAFIHPLWSPKGQILTRIQPEDHYHHYGIWNPWTQVTYDGQNYDLWNLVKNQGRVKFANFQAEQSGAVFAEYSAKHEHLAHVAKNKKIVIMNEVQTVRVYRPDENYYLMDLTIDLSAATAKTVTLAEYRYGGFGWRATEQWHKGNSEVMSSEGLDRTQVDSTLGRWFYVQGEVDNSYAGAEVMSHPENFNHPEPMRIWPVNNNDRGDVYASFSPTKNTDWPIEPGKHYIRNYRFLVYNGHLNKERAESAWKNYSIPVKVKIKTLK